MFFKKGVFNTAPLVPGTFLNIPSLGAVIEWLLKIEFSTDDPAPLLDPYVGEVGSLNVVDTGAIMSVSGGEVIPSATITGVADPSLTDVVSRTRATGLACFVNFRNYTAYGIATNSVSGGFAIAAVPSATQILGFSIQSNLIRGKNLGAGVTTELASMTDDTLKKMCIVLLSTGHYIIDATEGILAWVDNVGNQATVYPAILDGVAGRAPFGLDYIRCAQLSAPFDTDLGLAMDYELGAVSAGKTFSAVSSYNAVTGDANHELIATTVPSPGSIYYFFREQDPNNRWNIRITAGGDLRLEEVIDGTPTNKQTAAGVVSDGGQIKIIAEGETIRGYYNDAIVWTHTGASNFKTATDSSLDSLGTGGAVSNIKIRPVKLAGSALQEITRHAS